MKHFIQKRISELQGFRDENNESLEKNRLTLEKINSELHDGTLRNVAIVNRLDELEKALAAYDDEEDVVDAVKNPFTDQ
jgi:hypothetical protein